MEKIFFDFTQTKEALSQLAADLSVLDSELQSKSTAIAEERKDCRKVLAEKEELLDTLRANIQATANRIDDVTSYINGVL